MKVDRRICIALYVVLSGCGGGGSGGIVSTPTSPGAPSATPTPTPTPIATPTPSAAVSDPIRNVSYTVSAAASSLNATSGTNEVSSANTTHKDITISFDAAANKYRLVLNGRTTDFASSNATSNASDTVYHIGDTLADDWLTVQKRPYDPSQTSRYYVNLAFVQRNQQVGTNWTLDVAFFPYGVPTVASQVPRTGSLQYTTDGIGLITSPGKQPLAFEMYGGMAFDFSAAQFNASLGIKGFPLSGLPGIAGGSGGSYLISAAGQVSSNTGLFSGTFNIAGFIAAVPGTISGSFFGPNATELGATLIGLAADGSTVSGALTGKVWTQGSTEPVVTLSNIPPGNFFYTLASNGATNFRRMDDGSYLLVANSSDVPRIPVSTPDLTASANPNFTAYAKTDGGNATTLKLYKVGPANTEFALSYVSFGDWTMNQPGKPELRDFFLYGLKSNNVDFQVRTGNARYEGIIYGSASNATLNGTYDVRGASYFDVNFDSDTVAGRLNFQTIPLNGSPALDLGKVDFSGTIHYWGVGSQPVDLNSGDIAAGLMNWAFYGPNAQELAAAFNLRKEGGPSVGSTQIIGVTLAKEK